MDRLTKVTANPAKHIRAGLWRCGHCKGQFTAKIGTVFEHARIPLHKMLQATYLMTASKKGVSAHQLHRVLAEFEFRYNNREALGCNDRDRSQAALRGIVGKRLTYQTAC